MKFSEKLKVLRKRKGLTQEELASRIFVSRTLITKYESGSIPPTRENIEKLANFFKVDVSELCIVEKNPEINSNEKIKRFFLILVVFLCASFCLFVVLPIWKIAYYDTSTKPPQIMYIWENGLSLSFTHSNPLIIVAFSLSLIVSSLSIFYLVRGFSYIFKICIYILFVIDLFLMLFAIIFVVSNGVNGFVDF